ncbi:hypothetical protein IG631_19822 [Alternaria alternata]|nr:hypothetical protein IG631_19822 [Alternaria alternata]
MAPQICGGAVSKLMSAGFASSVRGASTSGRKTEKAYTGTADKTLQARMCQILVLKTADSISWGLSPRSSTSCRVGVIVEAECLDESRRPRDSSS